MLIRALRVFFDTFFSPGTKAVSDLRSAWSHRALSADSGGISTPGAGSAQLWASPKCSTHLPLGEANQLNKQGTCSGKIEYFVNSVDRGDGNFIPNTNSWEFTGEGAQPMSFLIKDFTSSFYFLLQTIFLSHQRENIIWIAEMHHFNISIIFIWRKCLTSPWMTMPNKTMLC